MKPLHDVPQDETWREQAGCFGRPWLLFFIISGLLALTASLLWSILRFVFYDW